MRNVLVGIMLLGLVACSGGNTSSTITETKPNAEIDCTKLDPNAADYPEACKAGPQEPPPPPVKCQYDPCEGDPQPVQQ